MPGEYGGQGGGVKVVLVGALLLSLLRTTPVTAGPSVPEVTCYTSMDCAVSSWTSPLPECIDAMCQCPSGTCAHYTTGRTQFTYYCGRCGSVGSECNTTDDCNSHWECKNNFCACDRGTLYTELCIYSTPVPTSVTSVVLIIILALLLILQKLIHSRKMLRSCCRCRSCRNSAEEEETRVVGYNPQSNNKTAAYTITNSDFMATSDDPDLEWALELSRRMSERDTDEITSPTSCSATSYNSPISDNPSRRHRPSSTTSRSLSSQPGPSGWRPERSPTYSRSSASSQSSTCRTSRRPSLSSRSSFSSVPSLSSSTSFNSARPSVSSYNSFISSPHSRSSSQSSTAFPTPDSPPTSSTSYLSDAISSVASSYQEITPSSPTSATTSSFSLPAPTPSISSVSSTSSIPTSTSTHSLYSSASSATISSFASTSSLRQNTRVRRHVSRPVASTCVSVPMGIDESDLRGTTV